MSIEAIHNALARADFETAFDVLEQDAQFAHDPKIRCALDLEAAGMYALYGREGIEPGQGCLTDALQCDANVRDQARYQALKAVFAAYALEAEAFERGERLQRNDDPRFERTLELALAALQSGPDDAVARFHVVAALVTLGESERALEVLQFDIGQLPEFLRWRALSWQGGALEELQRWREAAQAYATGANLTSGNDRAALLMDQAAMLLEVDEPHEALAALEASARSHANEEPLLEAASRLHLEARAHLALDNPALACERAEAARALELEANEPSHGTALVHGQALAALGEWSAALLAFRAAVERAGPLDRTYALHEMGLAQMDSGDLDGASDTLLGASKDPNYAFQAEVFADRSEVEYRRGDFSAAESLARIALERGATVPASLMLANIAYEYFRLDEALEHYQRVLELAPEGARDWVIAHEMIADTLVQAGWRDPARILEHASLALPHLEPSDEWVVTLEGYVQRANELLRPNARTLN